MLLKDRTHLPHAAPCTPTHGCRHGGNLAPSFIQPIPLELNYFGYHKWCKISSMHHSTMGSVQSLQTRGKRHHIIDLAGNDPMQPFAFGQSHALLACMAVSCVKHHDNLATFRGFRRRYPDPGVPRTDSIGAILRNFHLEMRKSGFVV